MGQDSSLKSRISLNIERPPPLRKPKRPKIMKNPIGMSTIHSRTSRLNANHSFFPMAHTGCRTRLFRVFFRLLRFFPDPSLRRTQPVRNPFSTSEVENRKLASANKNNRRIGKQRENDPFAAYIMTVFTQVLRSHTYITKTT